MGKATGKRGRFFSLWLCRFEQVCTLHGLTRLRNYKGGKAMTIDRSEVSRAFAKSITYKQCGKDKEAAQWAARVVQVLECAKFERGSMAMIKLSKKDRPDWKH